MPAFPGNVEEGTRGDAARQVQGRLAARGWTIDVDGDFGAASTAVLRRFQKDKGLAMDGICGIRTWTALWTTPT
jgi:peptidoglycan hydrolase-like protein with peptidoglycan-binding domain